MKKECVVCGRTIRTGWKYCYIHRNYSKERYNEDDLDFKDKLYIKRKLGFFWNFIHEHGNLSFYTLFSIMVILTIINSKDTKRMLDIFFISCAIILVYIIITSYILKYKIKKIRQSIIYEDQEYLDWKNNYF